MHIHCFRPLRYIPNYQFDEYSDDLVTALWEDFFKLAFDTFPASDSLFVLEVKDRYDSFKWYEVYDLIEFISSTLSDLKDDEDYSASEFDEECNRVLQRELSGYRLINSQISPITSTEEISTIEDAIKDSPDSVSQHLESALASLSDRKEPNYRNSIHDSICAVEAICKKISCQENATLAQAIKEIRKNNIVELHEALAGGFDKLFGWTSSDAGIRHAMMNESNLDQEDAIFMLVSCSAFTNYLIVKADKAGINLSK